MSGTVLINQDWNRYLQQGASGLNAPMPWTWTTLWHVGTCEECSRQFWFQVAKDRQPTPRKCCECEP